MLKNTRPSRYYHWLLKSEKHKIEFENWLVDNNFDVYSPQKFISGEVIAFNGKGGRGSLFISGFANKQCIIAIREYLKSQEKSKPNLKNN